MGEINSCEGITKNNYICMTTNNSSNTYKLNFDNEIIKNENKISNQNIYISKNQISLTNSSNHYLVVDEKAHCSKKWQDWFCIPNYHNNNSYNKYPDTEIMSVGTCYMECDTEYIISNPNKCYKYTSENDLIYNPLAIIALLGAQFNNETIGIRGSYLNDLYRVNNNDTFIKDTYVKNLLSDLPLPISNTTNQEIFLLQILKKIIKKADNYLISDIKDDIKSRITNFILFLNKNEIKTNIEKKNIFLNKIKNYSFDIDRLDVIYGEDKNKKSKFINIIAYAYNIARLILYDSDKASTNTAVTNKIDALLKNNFPLLDDGDKNLLCSIFKYACYNCFNYNFQLFDNYFKIKKNFGNNHEIMRISLISNEPISKKFIEYFTICNNIELTEIIVSKGSKYTIPYNNIRFYDHYLLSEYSDNTRYIIQLLLIFTIIFCLILFICLFYMLLMYKPPFLKYSLIRYIIPYVNYVHLFYKWLTFNLLKNISQGYLFICKLCKYKWNITSVVMNILNICILIYLVSYLFTSIIDLLSIDYINLIANINYDGKGGDTTMSIVNHKTNSTIFYYLLCIYLISIYIYSAYLIRYSKSSSEYDIISNFDADDSITENYLNNLLLSEYASNMYSNFDSSYTTKELAKASKVAITYHYDNPESAKEPDKKASWYEYLSGASKDINNLLNKDDNVNDYDNNLVDDHVNDPVPEITYGSDTPEISSTEPPPPPPPPPTPPSTPPPTRPLPQPPNVIFSPPSSPRPNSHTFPYPATFPQYQLLPQQPQQYFQQFQPQQQPHPQQFQQQPRQPQQYFQPQPQPRQYFQPQQPPYGQFSI